MKLQVWCIIVVLIWQPLWGFGSVLSNIWILKLLHKSNTAYSKRDSSVWKCPPLGVYEESFQKYFLEDSFCNLCLLIRYSLMIVLVHRSMKWTPHFLPHLNTSCITQTTQGYVIGKQTKKFFFQPEYIEILK